MESIQKALDAVLVQSTTPDGLQEVKGYDFEGPLDYHRLFETYATTGFQATSLHQAIQVIRQMIKWRLSDEPVDLERDDIIEEEERQSVRCTIFLGYTSNMISSGIRESIRFLAKNAMVSCIVTTAGGIEEDFIKCLAPSFVGDFHLPGAQLRAQGLNRIGNLLIPNDNYVKFENWIYPILDTMLEEQVNDKVLWTPSKLIHRLGKEIDHEESVYYWAYKNDIPVFCPAITDGSIGDMIYFHSYKRDDAKLIIDVAEDIRKINNMAVRAPGKTGMLILGGGVVKHHVCNANLMRNGADFSIFINTGQEFDGSDSGARPDEAISWGKIRGDAKAVKVYTDASLVFPIIIGETFAKCWEN